MVILITVLLIHFEKCAELIQAFNECGFHLFTYVGYRLTTLGTIKLYICNQSHVPNVPTNQTRTIHIQLHLASSLCCHY